MVAKKLKPLRITCTSSNCSEGLHCFRETRRMRIANKTGACRSCGIELIDWSRLRAKDLGDVTYTFDSLRLEQFRHYFWHVAIDQEAIDRARKLGKTSLHAAIKKRLLKSVGPANPPFDGRQTPREGSGNIIYYAQHATATCCRTCIKAWYGIPKERALSDTEIDYFAELVMRYVVERLPDVGDLAAEPAATVKTG